VNTAHTAAEDMERAMLAHELRTPLTCIIGFSTVLIEGWSRLPDDQRLAYIEKILHHATTLHDVVDELIEHS
jgi:signal transduction histidine kinase